MTTFALNSTSSFSLDCQLFFRNHAKYRNRKDRAISERVPSSPDSKRSHVPKKSHDQKAKKPKKIEMEAKDELSLSQRYGAALCTRIRTGGSRNKPFSETQEEGGRK